MCFQVYLRADVACPEIPHRETVVMAELSILYIVAEVRECA
jgi:hypothetical protein